MNKSAFIKKLLEIYVNTTLPHPDDSYSHIDFEVMITPKYENRSRIAVFSGDHGIFPIILEITDNPHHIELGYIDVFLMANKPVRKSKKQRDLLKLIMKYLQQNNLIKFSHD
ncbi:Uncharacterised protein [Acinetobacter baumannii]|uniref:hypothetical protein n=1 Tax=Acinetobacter baumannii TaxID=470 RepID=UPI000DE76160|nr:hypothetical protein [Acinetobacter baumannii]MCJ9203897.1 hypothetical protein [Acinetobacter baumannii]MCJ9354516.1 hypothetical protein [Acinetobacter baumannii]SSP03444.1 Uncharacterised protein [Acinetobacter baumannii]SST91211.1 Uncharacterised protein [Acinetobacter baumannii]SSU14164.1 Uncharacterised protein [Acinetobacter baumannii]